MTERPYETNVPGDGAAGAASTGTEAMTRASSTGTTSPSGGAAGSYPGSGTGTTGATSTTSASSDWTNGTSGSTSGNTSGNTSGSTTTDVKQEAKSVAADAVDSGRNVADTAVSGAKDVAAEAKTQLRQLFEQVRGELDDQASSQGQRAVSGLRSLADELREMNAGSTRQGLAGEAAQQAADRASSFADWLEHREPGEMLDELRSLARRRPGAFLLGAALVGVVGGRMTRGLTSGSGGADTGSRPGSSTYAPTSGTAGQQYGTLGTRTSAAAGGAATPGSGLEDGGDSYTVGVRDTETHAMRTSGDAPDPFDETITEGRGGVR